MTEKHAELLRIQAENRERRKQKAHEHRERKEKKERERDEAWAEAWRAYRDSQPTGQIPAWVFMNAGCSSGHTKDERGWAEIFIWKKQVYPPGYQWEIGEDGYKWLVCINPETGEKGIVISYDPPSDDLVILFRCIVEFPSKEVTVLLASDAAKLDAAQFELSHEDLEWCEAEVRRRGW